MAKAVKEGIYKCDVCGNIVEYMFVGGGQLVCCNEPMKLYEENTVDAAKEKHVPVLEECEGGVLIKVGSAPHPMTEEHSIQWVEVINGDYVNRKYLHPGNAPEAAFYVPKQKGLIVRAYCNLHGLWEARV